MGAIPRLDRWLSKQNPAYRPSRIYKKTDALRHRFFSFSYFSQKAGRSQRKDSKADPLGCGQAHRNAPDRIAPEKFQQEPRHTVQTQIDPQQLPNPFFPPGQMDQTQTNGAVRSGLQQRDRKIGRSRQGIRHRQGAGIGHSMTADSQCGQCHGQRGSQEVPPPASSSRCIRRSASPARRPESRRSCRRKRQIPPETSQIRPAGAGRTMLRAGMSPEDTRGFHSTNPHQWPAHRRSSHPPNGSPAAYPA